MESQFWIERWREGQIGFHEGAPNAFLQRFADRLAGIRVLVPLCGKTEDLAYLGSRGHEVVGVELVEDAARAFFAEHELTPAIERRGPLAVYTAGAITVISGDLFAVSIDDTGPIDAIYDRAALIALPPEVRPRYVAHLRTLVRTAPAVLVTVEYPQDLMSGPPFSVPEAEVRTLYRNVEPLADHPATGGRLSQLGAPALERCYAVTL